MSKLYKTQIKRLKWVIKNWDLIKNDPIEAKNKFKKKFKVDLSLDEGLCNNCNLNYLDISLKQSMFKHFLKFSGNFIFPLETFEQYSIIQNFAGTYERLELAKHCLKFLKKQRKKELNIHE